jgi:hypothetical protein
MLTSIYKTLYRAATLPNRLPNHPIAARYLRSGLAGSYRLLNTIRNGGADPFSDVETYCIFVGHPRSGHSLVGALLDAHPNIAISNELFAQKLLLHGATRNELFSLILGRSSYFPHRDTPQYRYKLPSQHKGEYTTLRVIGDKSGGDTAKVLAENPALLDSLPSRVGAPVNLVHVTRHPLDNIASLCDFREVNLDEAIEKYFDLCRKAQVVKEEGFESHTLRLEEFIQDTPGEFAALCEFFGVPATQDYLKDCSSLVFDEPSRSRIRVDWTPQQVRDVYDQSTHFVFLQHYVERKKSWNVTPV